MGSTTPALLGCFESWTQKSYFHDDSCRTVRHNSSPLLCLLSLQHVRSPGWVPRAGQLSKQTRSRALTTPPITGTLANSSRFQLLKKHRAACILRAVTHHFIWVSRVHRGGLGRCGLATHFCIPSGSRSCRQPPPRAGHCTAGRSAGSGCPPCCVCTCTSRGPASDRAVSTATPGPAGPQPACPLPRTSAGRNRAPFLA